MKPVNNFKPTRREIAVVRGYAFWAERYIQNGYARRGRYAPQGKLADALCATAYAEAAFALAKGIAERSRA